MYTKIEYETIKLAFEAGYRCSENGESEEKYEEFFKIALNSKNSQKILFNLSDQYLNEGSKDLARQSLELASRISPDANYKLANLYLDGVFGDGTEESQYNNATEHTNGIFEDNGNTDYETAIFHFQEAASKGCKDAEDSLKFLNHKGKCPTRFPK